jgi:SAM-dependent methyltransferase
MTAARSGAAQAQASYHRHLYEALWDTGVAADVVDGAAISGLEQMGHFGSAGCDLVVDVLAKRLAGRPATVLELGCGFGGALRHVLGRLADAVDVRLAVGVDLVAEHCRLMHAMGVVADARRTGFAVCTSVNALGLADRTFDAVFASGSASHFSDMGGTLAEAFRVLRPGGVLTFVEEVSLLTAEPSARFRKLHPLEVFAASSWPQRERQLRECGFTDIDHTDLSAWASDLLRKRLLAMRIYRKKIEIYYGAARTQEIVDTLTIAQQETAAGTLTPVHVTACRPDADADGSVPG